MTDRDELRQIVTELTEVVHAQAKHLERLVERGEPSAGRHGLEREFAVSAAETAALLVRLKKLDPAGAT